MRWYTMQQLVNEFVKTSTHRKDDENYVKIYEHACNASGIQATLNVEKEKNYSCEVRVENYVFFAINFCKNIKKKLLHKCWVRKCTNNRCLNWRINCCKLRFAQHSWIIMRRMEKAVKINSRKKAILFHLEPTPIIFRR